MKKTLMLTLPEPLKAAANHGELSHSFIVMTTAEVERCVHAYSVGEGKGHDVICYAFSLLNMESAYSDIHTVSACINNGIIFKRNLC